MQPVALKLDLSLGTPDFSFFPKVNDVPQENVDFQFYFPIPIPVATFLFGGNVRFRRENFRRDFLAGES